MSQSVDLGSYILDTLQIYFSWDDDLYTELKQYGFGTGNFKALPLIYSDNTESTTNQKHRRRKFVLRPESFGGSYETLGWTETDRKAEPIIPAEKPLVNFSLMNLDSEPKIKATIIPTVDDREQYHIEYSSMAAFGKGYTNWVALYFTPKDFISIVDNLRHSMGAKSQPLHNITIQVEGKQNQREEMRYVELPVEYYKFCIGAFKYALDYFRNNGVEGVNVPCLLYDNKDRATNEVMSPFIKLGVVHTTQEAGFDARKPQFVMKIAQPKMTISRRGVSAKVKGMLTYEDNHECYFIIDALLFMKLSDMIIAEFRTIHG